MASKNYEQARDERIKENLLRMQNLGILDLTQKLKSRFESSKPAQKKTPKPKCPPSVPLPRRRSSRLQKVTPVSYVESRKHGNNSTWETKVLLEDGSVPEIYTEEHEKLLGTCTMPWELFKDGYGADGKRIYDQVNGKTCHQCRQKTLGHRTHCSKCNLVQGQFCGDCLYMRYGEHVLEANENPEWVCPVCRGICNCSLCRLKKGWVPTGMLYKKISSLGFKSVAHFLIQTRRSVPNSAGPVTIFPTSAKRSLHFADTEDMETDSHNWDAVDDEGNNNIIGAASKSSRECKNKLEEEDPTVTKIDKNKQKKCESKMRIKVAVSKPVLGKRLRQDDNDAGVPSGAKLAKVLLVSEDGVVHFAHESNPKPSAVPQLSSDGILHVVWESDPKHTAALEKCSNSACFGAGGAQALVAPSESEVEPSMIPQQSSDNAQALVAPSESEVKPSMIPQQSSDNVIHAASHCRPEPVTPATASSNGICNGELGYKATGIGAVSESNKDAETQLCSDSISSVASPGKLKPTAGVRDGALGAEASGVVADRSSDSTIPVAFQSASKTTGPQELALDGVCRGAFTVADTGCASSECIPNRDAETQPFSDGIPSVASLCKLKPTAAPDLSSVDVGTLEAGVLGVAVEAVEPSEDVVPIALQSEPDTTGSEALALGAVCSGAVVVTDAVGVASESVLNRDAGALLHSDGVPSVESPSKATSTVPQDLSSVVDVGNGASGAEALGVAMDPSSDSVIPVALHHSGALGVRDSGVALESRLELAKSPKASSSSSSGGRVHVALQSELQAPGTPKLSSESISIGKFGSSQGIAATTRRKKESKTVVVTSPSWDSIAGRLKIRRRSMSS